MKRFFSIVLLTSIFVSSYPVFGSAEDSYINFTVHNIGQGNCMTAELYEVGEQNPTFILMDAGSNAYKDDLACQEYFKKKLNINPFIQEKSKNRELSLEASSYTSTFSEVPGSEVKPITPGIQKFRQEQKQDRKKSQETEMIKSKVNEIRVNLGQKKSSQSIHVKTIFVSHPDTDHYNWLERIFTHNEDKIDNIILGGLPESYHKTLCTWLNKQIARETKIYFPAIECKQPLPSFKALFPRPPRNFYPYAPQMYSHPETGWPQKAFNHLENFKEALPWGENIKTYLLTVNPTHYQRERTKEKETEEKISRVSLHGDDNSDSLVINFRIGNNSIIVTGDATNITTQRVIENYGNSPEFFDVCNTILVADHHGSYTDGSNSDKWIHEVSPSYVVFSCGTKHNHPSIEAYEKFKQSTNLKQLSPSHEIWVYAEEKDLITKKISRKPKNHITHAAIFSTFNSGTIEFKLLLKSISLQTSMSTNFKCIQPISYMLLEDAVEEEVLYDLSVEDLAYLNTEENDIERKNPLPIPLSVVPNLEKDNYVSTPLHSSINAGQKRNKAEFFLKQPLHKKKKKGKKLKVES